MSKSDIDTDVDTETEGITKEITKTKGKWEMRFCPNEPKDLVGRSKEVNCIEKWLKGYTRNRKKNAKLDKKQKAPDDMRSCMMLTGNHGIGKTCTIEAVLKSLDYEIRTVDFSQLDNLKNPTDYAHKLLKNTSIYELLVGERDSKYAIVVDNLESVKSLNEKKFIEALLSENIEKWSKPIIFISDNKHNKFINSVKKKVYKIEFSDPSDQDFMELLIKICTINDMHMKSEKIAKKIIENSQKDYRKLMSLLEDLYTTKENDTIDMNDLKECLNFVQMKNNNWDIYSTVAAIFQNKKYHVRDILSLYETQRTLMPLMVQENYIKHANRYYEGKNSKKKDNKSKYDSDDEEDDEIMMDKLDMLYKISDSVVKADIIENHIYENQMWSLQDAQGFFSCVNPNRIITDNIKAPKTSNKKLYTFPVDLNKVSIRSINKKNIKKAQVGFPGMDVLDILNAKKIFKNLLETDRHTEFRHAVEGYNATPDRIQATIKVDKILDTKTGITTGLAKKITEYTKK